MKTASAFAILSFVFATGCALDVDESDISSDEELASLQEESRVYSFSNGLVPRSEGELVRGSSFELEVESTVEPKHVVTAWLCGWTNPDECTAGAGGAACGTGDHGNAAAGWFCQFGGGGIANSRGKLEIENEFDPGAVNAPTTEFRVILRTHGTEIPGLLEEQITTANGGCDINACANIQYTHFPALQ